MKDRLFKYGFVLALAICSAQNSVWSQETNQRIKRGQTGTLQYAPQTLDFRQEAIDRLNRLDEKLELDPDCGFEFSKQESHRLLRQRIRNNLKLLLDKHPEIDQTKICPFEVVFCIDKKMRINHIFFLGMKEPLKALVSEIGKSLDGDIILLLPEFFTSSPEEINFRIYYPDQNNLDEPTEYKAKKTRFKKDNHLLWADWKFKINYAIRTKLDEYIGAKNITDKNFQQFQIEFSVAPEGQVKITRSPGSSKIEKKTEEIIQSLSKHDVMNPPDKAEKDVTVFFSYPIPDYYSSSNNYLRWWHRTDPSDTWKPETTPSFSEYLRRNRIELDKE